MIRFNEFKVNEKGLVPVVVQDVDTGKVLMLAYMNEEAMIKSLETGFAHYYSRSREKLWLKGETSGNTQQIVEMNVDCDKDTILIKVKQKGVACHTGEMSCFYRSINKEGEITEGEGKTETTAIILQQLYQQVVDRKENRVEGSYTNYLFDKGIDKILKKIGEESSEIIIAAKNPSNEELCYEISDFIYHLTVLMVERNIKLEDIYNELQRRRK